MHAYSYGGLYRRCSPLARTVLCTCGHPVSPSSVGVTTVSSRMRFRDIGNSEWVHAVLGELAVCPSYQGGIVQRLARLAGAGLPYTYDTLLSVRQYSHCLAGVHPLPDAHGGTPGWD